MTRLPAPVIPGPLILNVEALRNEAEVAAGRSFGKKPRWQATEVRVTSDDQIMVLVGTKDGRTRWATLLEPEGDISRLGILRFEFAPPTAEAV